MKQTAEETILKTLTLKTHLESVGVYDEVIGAMEEHSSNQLASYKADLREKLLDLVYVIPDYDSGTEAVVIDYSSAKALLEDNPTEK